MSHALKFGLILLAASGVVFAQSQSSTGGWRRATDPPPAIQEQPGANTQAGDPTEPVDRSDAYGQPQEPVPQTAPPPATPYPNDRPPYPNDRPPSARTNPPHYGLPGQISIRPGTFVQVRTSQYLSSDHNQEGDIFSATLAQPIVVDGVVVAQRGQSVVGRITQAKKAGRASGVSQLSLQLTGLTLADGAQANVQSQMVTRNGQTSVGNDVAAIGATTAMGAAIGAAADWGRGAAIGAGAGAVAGLAGVLLTRGRPTEVLPETLLSFRIDTPVTVDTTRAPQAFRYVDPYEYDRPAPPTQVVRRQPGPPPCAGYRCGAPPPYPYGGWYGGWYGPAYGYYPYWGWGGGVVVVGHGGYGYGYHRWR